MNENHALNIEYDFATATGTVTFLGDHKLVVQEVVAYFEEASDGKVRRINVSIGDLQVTLARNDEGGWAAIDNNQH